MQLIILNFAFAYVRTFTDPRQISETCPQAPIDQQPKDDWRHYVWDASGHRTASHNAAAHGKGKGKTYRLASSEMQSFEIGMYAAAGAVCRDVDGTCVADVLAVHTDGADSDG